MPAGDGDGLGERRSGDAEPEPVAPPDQEPVAAAPGNADAGGTQILGSSPFARRLRERFDRGFGGRPLGVYGVLAAGAAVLLILLAIIWITATGPSDDDPPNCLPMARGVALTAVARGEVEQINVTADREQSDQRGVIAVGLNLTDETCRLLELGDQTGQQDAWTILGRVEFRNRVGDEDIRVRYELRDIPRDVLVTATPTALPTAPPSPTPPPTAPPPTAIASPIASPIAIPTTPPTATATATATATPRPPPATATAIPTRSVAPPTSAPLAPTAAPGG